MQDAPSTTKRMLTLDEARMVIQDADLLLSPWVSLVGWAGRGEYGHAAKLAWWNDEVWILELVGWGQAIPLAARVKAMPGYCALFRANAMGRWPEYSRQAAVAHMKRLVGGLLDWKATILAVLAHTPLWPVAKALSWVPGWDEEYTDGRHCAGACAEADRAGGVDPVPMLADCYTEPSDLARSPFYEYVGHLIP